MLFGAGCYTPEGDSAPWGTVLVGEPLKSFQDHPYFRSVDPSDPLVFPLRSEQILARFPPSLFVSATRDWVLSSVVHMHSRLVALGVETRLHVWEGLGHAFFFDPDLPQSREVHRVVVDFFDRFLGRE